MNFVLSLFIVSTLFLVSCAKTDNQSGSEGGYVRAAADSLSENLKFTNLKEMESYLGGGVAGVEDLTINFRLRRTNYTPPERALTSLYEGEISLSYYQKFHDGSRRRYEDVFETGYEYEDVRYNYAYIQRSSSSNSAPLYVWKGFFQDDHGSLIVILQGGLGDDGTLEFDLANGSVWYRNWPAQCTRGSLPSKKCWNIWAGPYDCRAWEQGKGMDIHRALLPASSSYSCGSLGTDNDSYRKLGDFKNLNIMVFFQTFSNTAQKLTSQKRDIASSGVTKSHSHRKTKLDREKRDLSSAIEKKQSLLVYFVIGFLILCLGFLGLVLWDKKNRKVSF